MARKFHFIIALIGRNYYWEANWSLNCSKITYLNNYDFNQTKQNCLLLTSCYLNTCLNYWFILFFLLLVVLITFFFEFHLSISNFVYFFILSLTHYLYKNRNLLIYIQRNLLFLSNIDFGSGHFLTFKFIFFYLLYFNWIKFISY